jgi:hypothetical protein
MESATQDYLRQAAAQALEAKDDASVVEILGLLRGATATEAPTQAPLALPAADPTNGGPAHSYHFWAQFIRDRFIPFMLRNGRDKFTSHELFAWLQNSGSPEFTSGDLKSYADGSLAWRNAASSGLNALKVQGVVHSRLNSRVYFIPGRLLDGKGLGLGCCNAPIASAPETA